MFVGKRSFAWDIDHKGPHIHLFNNNLTANKSPESEDYETVLGSISMASGRHYWEITIDKFVDLNDIIIGVCHRDMDPNSRPFDTSRFWGWMCTGG